MVGGLGSNYNSYICIYNNNNNTNKNNNSNNIYVFSGALGDASFRARSTSEGLLSTAPSAGTWWRLLPAECGAALLEDALSYPLMYAWRSLSVLKGITGVYTVYYYMHRMSGILSFTRHPGLSRLEVARAAVCLRHCRDWRPTTAGG